MAEVAGAELGISLGCDADGIVVLNGSYPEFRKMTEEELQLMKMGADAAMKPFSELMDTLFGGSAEEVSELWRYSWKIRRFGRQVKLMQRIQQMILESGLQPGRIPGELAIPLLSAANLEGDDSMQRRWAALLANAALPETGSAVQPVFIQILSHLSPFDARFLDACFEFTPISQMGVELDEDAQARLIARLAGQGLLRQEGCELTPLGVAFVRACRPPAMRQAT
jgi:hypothetical protein